MSMVSNVKGGVCCVPTCRQYRDLPFTCPKCGETTCEEHRIFQDHQCKAFFDPHVPTCPLCGQLVPCKVDENPNTVVSLHIEKGCPRESHTVSPQPLRLNFCSFSRCRANEHCLILCRFCGNQYCVSHRLQEDHECVKLKQAKGGTQSPPAHQSPTIPPVAKPPGAKVSNTPQTAVGNPNIEKQDRFLLCVYFLTPESRAAPAYLFFNKCWAVGKVLDKLCEHAKIRNENNSPDTEKHVHLYAVKSTQVLPASATLASLAAKLSSGDDVLLFRGTTLPPPVLTQLRARCSSYSSSSASPTSAAVSVASPLATRVGSGSQQPHGQDCQVC